MKRDPGLGRTTLPMGVAPTDQASNFVPTTSAGRMLFRIVDPTNGDHESLMNLVEAGHQESRFGYIPFSRAKAQRQLEGALAEYKRHLVAVAEVRGQAEGFVFASAGEYLVGTGVVIVTINAIYTSRELRGSLLGGRAAVGLFRAVGKWAKGIGAAEILLHVTSGISEERAGRTVGRLGFVPVGGSFAAKVR